MDELPIHYRLLRYYAEQALLRQKSRRIALAIARKLGNGDFDIISHFALDALDRPKADSLTYTVRVACVGGWADLVTVHWTLLGLEWTDVIYELRNTVRQQTEGSYPGGPLDPRRETT